jgi:TorA maturation chaperone TorD
MIGNIGIDKDSVDRLVLYSRIFNTLSKCFTHDAKYLLDVLEDLNRLLGFLGMDELCGRIMELCRLLREKPELVEEYSRLFEFGDVSLYESDYLYDVKSPSKLYVKADISGFYRAFGIKPVGEMPDHISTELEFISLLLIKEAYALMNQDISNYVLCRNARQKFYREHLGIWVDKLVERVRNKVENIFYISFFEVLYTILTSLLSELE